jgi:hypothetical protein
MIRTLTFVWSNQPMPTIDEILDARAERNQAWSDHMRGRIDQAELYAILRRIRERFGQQIYQRNPIEESE